MNATIIWRLDLDHFCDNISWRCSTDNIELVSSCQDTECIKLWNTGYFEIRNISTRNQYNLTFNYTLNIVSLEDTQSFTISFVNNNEMLHVIQYDIDTMSNMTTFSIACPESIENKSSISIHFRMNATSDTVYISDAIIYNQYISTITTLESEWLLIPISSTMDEHDNKVDNRGISFGTNYEDIRMFIHCIHCSFDKIIV